MCCLQIRQEGLNVDRWNIITQDYRYNLVDTILPQLGVEGWRGRRGRGRREEGEEGGVEEEEGWRGGGVEGKYENMRI